MCGQRDAGQLLAREDGAAPGQGNALGCCRSDAQGVERDARSTAGKGANPRIGRGEVEMTEVLRLSLCGGCGDHLDAQALLEIRTVDVKHVENDVHTEQRAEQGEPQTPAPFPD